jgi:acetyl esterase
MTIHPEIAKILATLPAPDGAPLDPATMRAGEAVQVPPLEERQTLHAVEDATAVTPSGEVPVRIYTPLDADAYGLLVYFHGGAFFLGSLDTHDHVARSLAKETGHKVISVGYRLSPEAAFPAGLEDCYGVVRWAAAQGDGLKWDGKNLAIAGDSSGANFVAAVAADCPRRRFRPDHPPGPVLPLARPGFRRRPLPLPPGERRRVRPGNRGPQTVQLLLPRERR